MAWLDKLKQGLEQVAGQVGEAGAELKSQQFYRMGRRACESGFVDRHVTDALADLQQAVTVDADFAVDAHRWLAKAYQAAGSFEGARQSYVRALELLEADDAGRIEAWIAGEYAVDPDDYRSELHDDLASLLATLNRPDEVIYHANRAIEANRDNLNAYHTLIASLHATGDTEEVKRWLFRARERDSLGLVDQWVAELDIDEQAVDAEGAGPVLQFHGIELAGPEIEDDHG